MAEKCETPIVIGLYGSWGIGKTSLMKLIEQQLNSPSTKSVWFDPWQHQFDENPVLALLHTVVDTFNMDEEEKKLLIVIASAFSSILLKATTLMSAQDIDDLGKRFEEERFQVREARVRLRKHFEKLINKAQGEPKKRLVFFIDDLDRCLPPQILSLLESLKLYLNLPNCVYFLGVDRPELEKSIKYHYKDIDLSESQYLDKIVQLPFNIPPIAPQSMEIFIDPMLSEELKHCRDLLVKGLGDNPRDIKRFINILTFNNELASTISIPYFDAKILTALLLIQYLNSILYRRIEMQPNLLIDLIHNNIENPQVKSIRDQFLTEEGDRLNQVISSLENNHIISPENLKNYIYLTNIVGVEDQREFSYIMSDKRRSKREKVNKRLNIGDHGIFIVDQGKNDIGFLSDDLLALNETISIMATVENKEELLEYRIVRPTLASIKSGYSYFYGAEKISKT